MVNRAPWPRALWWWCSRFRLHRLRLGNNNRFHFPGAVRRFWLHGFIERLEQRRHVPELYGRTWAEGGLSVQPLSLYKSAVGRSQIGQNPDRILTLQLGVS